MVSSMLAALPRVRLGHLPTPLEELGRLSKALGGPRILAKRDDCTGLAVGGNKVRKLEFLLAEALENGCDTIVTTGGLQSNHARQTAAACARLGLRCELVLPRLVPREDALYESGGNRMLDELLGARAHVVGDAEEAADKTAQLEADAESRGGRAAVIPAGGSTPTGALGYAAAVDELLEQTAAAGIRNARIVLAAGTGGTHAGLLAGLAGREETLRPTAIAVLEDALSSARKTDLLARECAARIGQPEPRAADVRDGFLGEGYGMPTPGMIEAVQLCARQEGLLLDPVYTGKAMAGLIGLIRDGELGTGDTVIFWHTGGTPGLFAYGPETFTA